MSYQRRSKKMTKEDVLQNRILLQNIMSKMSKQDDKVVNDRNLNSISKIDPFVAEIVSQSVHVALYDFDIDSKSWKRKEVAGPFFVYRRKAKPFVSFMIANRHSPDDFIQPILPSIRFELSLPFIFVNLSENKIIGLWFSTNEECLRIFGLLETFKQK